jgi:hypothetical protein
MNPELQALLANVKSLLDQIGQVAGGVAAPAESGEKDDMAEIVKMIKALSGEAEGSKADDMEDNNEQEKEKMNKEEDKEEDKVKKGDADGINANDKAESRLEDPQPDESQKTIDELKKALYAITKNKNVLKSKDANQELVKINQRLVDKVNELEKGLIGIYEGLGIVDEVKKSLAKPAPRQFEHDNNSLAKSLEAIIKGNEKSSQPQEKFSLAKALAENGGEALKGILGK